MSGILRLVFAAGAFAALPLASAALRAQASAPTPESAVADSLAFPRQFVKWVFSAEGDSAFAHAGPQLRESMKSAEEVNAMASRISTRFGEAQGTDAEAQFDEGALKVYIVVMRFAQAPEPAAWVVAYVPGTKVVERAAFTSLTNVKTRYPQAKLP
jgi:hypothetical protein